MDENNLFSLRKFVAPEFVFGWGARFLLEQYARNFAIRRPLVVTDSGVMAAGWAESVKEMLSALRIPFAFFSQVTPNPRDHEVMAGADLFRREECDSIVAVGGGSVIDTAKGIGIIASNGGHILDYEGVDQISLPVPPLICIPTTAGSSADVSQFAIISDSANKKKIAIISKTIVPDVALIDPETTTTMEPQLRANTAMDVLSHAIEAAVSNASSPITDLLALESIRLLCRHLPPQFAASPGEKEHLDGMMLSSLLAGMAFSNASLGLVHAMAHSLGGLKDSPHGECNSILIEHVVLFNFDAAPAQFRRIGEAMGLSMEGEEAKYRLVAFIGDLKKKIGLTARLRDIGVQGSDIPKLASNALKDPCLITNPRQPTLLDVESLYERAL